MAIKTSTFSGWRLSGKDADAFLNQIKNQTPNPVARKAIARGRSSVEEFLSKGYTTFISENKKKSAIK